MTINRSFAAVPELAVVIGYGNELRGDDAVGPWVARAVAGWGLPDVLALDVPQLTPELAEPLARAHRAVFVDARESAWEVVQVRSLRPNCTPALLAHSSDPVALLALTQAVFGRYPLAWEVSIPALNFALGEGLSPVARRGADEAIRHLARLVQTRARRAVNQPEHTLQK
jgi:hydrogenase maturation protease